jgi:hypothetical protein
LSEIDAKNPKGNAEIMMHLGLLLFASAARSPDQPDDPVIIC